MRTNTTKINSPFYRGLNNAKIKYYVKTENFILWAVSCVKSISSENLKIALNDYELSRIKYLKLWVENAPLEEIMGVMSKIGFPMFYGGETTSVKSTSKKRTAYRDTYLKKKSIDELTDYAAENKYFVVASREHSKVQTLFSQVLNGAWYVPNRDFKSMMKILKEAKKGTFDKANINDESQNMKAIIRVFSNFLLTKNQSFNDLELGILFYFADNDDKPIFANKIYEVFSFISKDASPVTRALVKLKKAELLESYGSKNKEVGSTYSLSYRGWNQINASIKGFMKDIKFWDLED